MNKEKQIEEMARAMCPNIKELQNSCEKCEFRNPCVWQLASISLHEKGYRKASEVARETVKAIMEKASEKEQYISELYGCGGFMIATTDLEDIIRRYIFDTYEEAELKKKYTESEK